MSNHYKQPTPYTLHLTMPVPIEIAIKINPANTTNNTLTAGQTGTSTSEHIVQAFSDCGCIVPVMLVMGWLWNSATIESVESFF